MTQPQHQAFPSEVPEEFALASMSKPFTGLTKRELFAAMAMQGIVSGVFASQCTEYRELGICAGDAVKMADALIAALNKKAEAKSGDQED